MALLTKAAILAARHLKTERVKAWGGEVLVREMSGVERDAFEESCYTGRGKDRKENFANLRARLVALCLVDEDGARLFATAEDVKALGDTSAAAIDRVYSVCQRMNGLSAKDEEDLLGESKPGPISTSPSS